MIDRDGLYERGIMSLGIGWQIPRMPGLGEVDWSAFFSGLYRVGYDGPVIIEHEDRRFEGTDELVKRGFLLARDVLAALCEVTTRRETHYGADKISTCQDDNVHRTCNQGERVP